MAHAISLRVIVAAKGALQCGSSTLVVRGISGKALGVRPPRPKPFPYEKYQYSAFWQLFDRTTPRFDENTKIVAVEGSHAIGKTKFAEELADELDMLYMPRTNMDFYYKSPYGADLRDYNEYLMPRNKTFDEKDFSRNPTGNVPGSCDRYLMYMFKAKFHQYYLALRHLFNTGQGVVLESTAFTHYAEIDAAYNAGWIDRTTRTYYYKMLDFCMPLLLRPNLIVYLDAPVETVQKNIAARNNEWDKNSPVWGNKQYLSDIYNTLKKDYLKKEKINSNILVYDWSQPGETEVVVEDIERLKFDDFGLYEPYQKDWRLYHETGATEKRMMFSNAPEYFKMMSMLEKPLYFDAEHLYLEHDELENITHVGMWAKGNRYLHGFNEDMGDKSVLFRYGYFSDYLKDWKIPRGEQRPWYAGQWGYL